MKANQYFNVSTQQVTTHRTEVLKIDGYLRGATDRWLQVHDSRTAPASNAVPLREWLVTATTDFYKEFKGGELHFANGCFIALSTAEGSYTASTDKMDVAVEMTKPEESVTVVAASSAGVFNYQLWSEADGASARKRIRKLIVTNLEAADRYIQLFAVDAPTNPGAVPISQWKIYATGDSAGRDTLELDFGPSGRVVDHVTVDGVRKYGCTFEMSETVGTLEEASGAGANWVGEYI